jgi:hypothetical protein
MVAETRVLFIPNGISWESQFDHGVKLFNQGYTVWIHEHSANDDCPSLSGPNGRIARCGQLTDQDGTVRLEPASTSHDKTETQDPKFAR